MFAALLLPACAPSENTITPDDPVATATADTAPADIGDAPETDPTVTEEGVDGFPDDGDLADWLFTLDTLHTIDFEIPDASVTALDASPYDWAQADVTIDGQPMSSIGVRLRGKIGSFRVLSGKPKFKISFDQFVDDQRFYGLEELSLNNEVVDCSYEKEVVGYKVFELAGVPTLRTGYAEVTVNGAPYGLYVMVETPSDRYLDRTFDDPSGNLYDGKYVWYGGYSYTLLDFGNGVDALYQLEEGTDVGNADITGVSTALMSSVGSPDFYATMGTVLDWDEFQRMVAVEQFIGHLDGYSMNTNNYRVYFDPTDGKARILPWDLDYTMLYDYQWGMTWSHPSGRITNNCFADPTCTAAQKAAMDTLLTTLDGQDWTAFLDRIEALTGAAAVDDPRRECAATDVQPWRDYVRGWLASQPAALRTWWGL